LLRDAEALGAKLGRIEEFGGVGEDVLAVVRAKVGVVVDDGGGKVEGEESKSGAGEKGADVVGEKEKEKDGSVAAVDETKSNGAAAKG